MNKHTPCIYKIDIGPYYYFGQTIRPRKRMYDHLNDLKRGKHYNIKMQRVYDKSFDDPRFSVVLYCEDEELNYYEETLIQKHYDDRYNMNIAKSATSPMKGRKLSKEHKKKVSKSLVGNTRSLGYKHTDETKKKVSKVLKGNTYARDMTMYTFVHDDGIAIECTVFDLYSSQNLDCAALWRVVKGKQKTHKGWRIK